MQCRRCRFDHWVGKIPWKTAWQFTPVFLPGESQEQRNLAGYGPQDLKELDMTEKLSSSKHRPKISGFYVVLFLTALDFTFAYYVIANIYVFMICSLLSNISMLLFFTIHFLCILEVFPKFIVYSQFAFYCCKFVSAFLASLFFPIT